MPQPPTLDYSRPPPPRRRLPWLVLIGMAAVIGTLYWSLTDWWVYIDYGPAVPPTPKFEMPMPWQIGESAVVGAVATAVLYGLYRLMRWWLH